MIPVPYCERHFMFVFFSVFHAYTDTSAQTPCAYAHKALLLWVSCVLMKWMCRGCGRQSAGQSGRAGQKRGGVGGGELEGHNLSGVCVLSNPSSPGWLLWRPLELAAEDYGLRASLIWATNSGQCEYLRPEIEKIKSYLTMTGSLVQQEATVKYSYAGRFLFFCVLCLACVCMLIWISDDRDNEQRVLVYISAGCFTCVQLHCIHVV